MRYGCWMGWFEIRPDSNRATIKRFAAVYSCLSQDVTVRPIGLGYARHCRAFSSVGRALPLQGRCRGFESLNAHKGLSD